jgi:hypothetical protein
MIFLYFIAGAIFFIGLILLPILTAKPDKD